MKHPFLLCSPWALAVLLAYSYPAVAQGATISAVDWGGQYVDSDTRFADHDPAKLSGGSDAYGDPDGPFTVNVNDSIAGRSLSTTRPWSPASGYSGTSGTFYGGESVTRTNSPLVDDGFTELSILNQGPNDSIHWHVDTGGDDHTFHLLLYWDKADFLGGLATRPNLDLSDGAFSFSTAQSSGHHSDEILRWVVRDGTQFYVSQKEVPITNNFDIVEPYSGLVNWALYSPTSVDTAGLGTEADLWSLDFDETGPYAPHTFTDVTAVGFYVEHEAATGPIHVHVEGFGATLVPEPSVAGLAGVALALGLGRRRRRPANS